MQQLNPQTVIDELSKRLQQAILENVVLSAQIRDLEGSAAQEMPNTGVQEVTVIGDQSQE